MPRGDDPTTSSSSSSYYDFEDISEETLLPPNYAEITEKWWGENNYSKDGSNYLDVSEETSSQDDQKRTTKSTQSSFSNSKEKIYADVQMGSRGLTPVIQVGPHTSGRTIVVPLLTNWNHEYQRLLIQNNPKLLENHVKKFLTQALISTRTIINERHRPIEEKTLRPISVGGFAGGDKYFAEGILFKFARDAKGIFGDEVGAQKAAACELRNLKILHELGIEGLHFPLMAMLDWKGSRVLAVASVPITSQTLVYGSRDGGITIENTDEKFAKMAEQIAKKLNLKPHRVGTSEDAPTLHLAGDVEGHKCPDGYYLLDFARVSPPQDPRVNKVKGGIMFNMLRPEFYRNYRTPLSPDAFSGWGKKDSDVHNKEIQEATKSLLDEVIPTFAKELMEHKYDETSLTEALHHSGINIRYLAKVLYHVTDDSIARRLLLEIICRGMKQLLRAELRSVLTFTWEEYQERAAKFMNLAFNLPQREQNKDQKVIPNITSEEWWQGILQPFLERKFFYFSEKEDNKKLLQELSQDDRALVHIFQELRKPFFMRFLKPENIFESKEMQDNSLPIRMLERGEVVFGLTPRVKTLHVQSFWRSK